MPLPEQSARAFFAAMNNRDFDSLELLLDTRVRFDFPGTATIDGARRMQVFLKLLFRRYETLVFTVDEVLADQDRACVVWTNEGHTSTGADYRNSGVTLMHFSGSSIIALSDYFKDTSFTGTF